MLKTKVTKEVVCDVCNGAISSLKVPTINIKGFDWHFCRTHFNNACELLAFLTVNVGLDIKFSVSEKDYNEILNNEQNHT